MKNNILTYLFFLLTLGFANAVEAQSDEESAFAPSLTAIALEKNQSEIIVNGSLIYNQELFNLVWDERRGRHFQQEAEPVNVLSGLLSYTFGLSERKNFNAGFDAIYSIVQSDNAKGSLFIGPRIRWRPFGALSNGFDFTMQHAVTYNALAESEATSDALPILITNQLLLTKYFENNLVLIVNGEVNALPKIAGVDQKLPIRSVAGASLSYFPQRNFAVFTSVNFSQLAATLPWLPEEGQQQYFSRGSAVDWGLGLQITFLNTYSLFAQHQLNLYEEFGISASAGSLGLRVLIN